MNKKKQVIKMGEEKGDRNYTYILRCRDGSLYTGWTNDLERRLQAHNQGKGAKYTKARRPVSLVYFEIFKTKEEAMKREAAIKNLSKKEKLSLIANNPTDSSLCLRLEKRDG